MTTVRHIRSIRFLPAFFLGLLSAACVCNFNFTFLDSIPKPKNDAGDSIDAGDRTRAVLEDRMGEPRAVAVFPSGAEVSLFAPQDDAAVTEAWVDVIGSAPAETVISLNDEITVAGADGMFYARVPLEEGLNEIQCVASDLEGNEVAFAFVVMYEHEE
ncbi:MAG: hypothetical protein JW748_04305 [Anaerolineales bacterium]|nr:hypothetical protein [Anaerolineales bacterium]